MSSSSDQTWILPLGDPRADLDTAGGKAASLARLVRAGLPVPPGFILTTAAYRHYVQTGGIRDAICQGLDQAPSSDAEALDRLSRQIRARFSAPIPEVLAREIVQAHLEQLGGGAVAVRSSATAEDLPELSFAGQQETFLNVIAEDALLRAVRDCWSSLWTARAIAYRLRNEIPQENLALAVIVQQMVPARASGVLFTANPLTGKRTEMVIDATLGLGEPLVSGEVEPDHYLIAQDGRLLEAKLGRKATTLIANLKGDLERLEGDHLEEQALPDEAISRLAALGRSVADLFGDPQDIEWAWDGRQLYLLQSRPITSLFPLPEGVPPEPLHVFISFGAIQGVLTPFTPLGGDLIQVLFAGGAELLAYRVDHKTQRALFRAGERLWVNITPVLRNRLGRRMLAGSLPMVDPAAMQSILKLMERLPAEGGPRLLTLLRFGRLLLSILPRFLRNLIWPEWGRERTLRSLGQEIERLGWEAEPPRDPWQAIIDAVERLHAARRLFPKAVIPHGVPAVAASMAPFYGILRRFSEELARARSDPALRSHYLELSRGVDHNLTTEMDLALWQTARRIQEDPTSRDAITSGDPQDLAQHFLQQSLPPVAQNALQAFLDIYGARGVGEIDIGRPRWREDPTALIQSLQGYLAIDDPSLAPDVVFARGAEVARQAGQWLETQVRTLPRGRLKAAMFRWALRRYRALAGLREAPKFYIVQAFGRLRHSLMLAAQALADSGLLAVPEEFFFFTLDELDALRALAARGKRSAASDLIAELRPRILERRARHRREALRRQIPRILLSDGTAIYAGMQTADAQADQLQGDPVSPGIAEGRVRVIADPHQQALKPGEILVCHGTDPAWTPLFLSAAGLVMEVGGMMTHGSVVAREYGIPAVVGVHEATRRLRTGMQVRIDGSSGVIKVLSGDTSRDA